MDSQVTSTITRLTEPLFADTLNEQRTKLIRAGSSLCTHTNRIRQRCLLLFRSGCIGRWCSVQRGKILQQQTMDEDVATAHFAQQEPLGGFIEKGDDVPG